MEYRSFRSATTSIGELMAEIVVKPTISLKYMVTSEYSTASTGLPVFKFSATVLQIKKNYIDSIDNSVFYKCISHNC